MTNLALSVHAIAALVFGASIIPATAAAAQPARAGVILVKPIAGVDDALLEKELKPAGGKVVRRLKNLEVRVVAVPLGKEGHLANALSKNRRIAFAEPDFLLEPVTVVNDPYISSQWHLPVMRASSAWDLASGQGVLVAVCDTGVNADHPDLAGQVLSGWNTVSNTTDTSDVHGHGTWVAGVIAAKANNLVGGASVAPAARILPLRVSDRTDGVASTSDLAEAVTYAADHGARVANLSYNVTGSSTVASAASYMVKKGGVVVVAAGNNGSDLGYMNSPYMFTAAATDSSDSRASYSNYGDYVDIAAPGSGIFTTDRGGGYASVSGTSFATPNTAATVALVMSANPSLTPTDVTSVITNTASDLGDAGWDPYYGHGRVDAFAAVELAAGASTSDRTAPDVAVASPGSGATVNDLVTVDVQATDAFGVVSVDFLVDGAVVASDTQADPYNPGIYRFAWDSTKVSDGAHQITARAKDAANNTGNAQAVSVNVANTDDTVPPTFVSRSPPSDASISGVVTLSASANDNVGMRDVTVSGGGVSCSGTTSASCNLNTRKIPNGTTLVVTFTATDTAGNTATEQSSVVVGTATTDTNTGDTTNSAGKAPPGKNK